jgi:hypothetical protein
VIKRQLKAVLINEKVSIMADRLVTTITMNNYLFTVVIRYFDKFKDKPIEQFVRMKRMMTVDATSILML